MMKKYVFILGALSVFVLVDTLGAEEYKAATFKQVYLKNLMTLRKRLANVRVRMQHDRIDHDTINTYLVYNDSFQSRTEYQTEKPLKDAPFLRIRSLNGDTVFDIQQRKNESEFTIVSFDTQTQGRESRWSKPYVLAAFHIMNASLKDLFEAPSTKIVSVTSAKERYEVIKVVLEIDPLKYKFHRVELFLLKDEQMALSEYQAIARFELPDMKEQIVQYSGVIKYDTPFTIPVPREVILKDTTIENGDVIAENTLRAERLEVQEGNVSEEEFSLAHFGIDGFDKAKSNNEQGRLLLIIVNVFMMIIILFAIIRNRRHKIS
ncbi:hypothetical protein [Gimesia fumaroli]|uniref:Uncharacterized protein n=1 Tax=Gimesia fumaroli TaxID=2527976 RepID=A0A518I7M2_9PLAN|nr:hypothetical protein [Gimesia fumaroli]QDV49049.1 hypothetical protein Enr17x_10640 [Gimesia fumaroli]